MALYLHEDWYKDRYNESVYPPGPFVTTYAYSGGDGWTEEPFGTQWGWSPGIGIDFIWVDATTSLTYPGFVTEGSKLKILSKSDGQDRSYLYRDVAANVLNTRMPKGGTYWFSFITKMYYNKDDLNIYLRGISVDAADTTDAVIYTHGRSTPTVTTPSVAYESSVTACFTGDAAYTPHCIVMRIQTGLVGDTVNIMTWADPDLSKGPEDWGPYGIGENGGLFCKTSIRGIMFSGPRNGSSTFPANWFDGFRIASTWYEAVGQPSDPAADAWPMYFWNKF